MDKSTFKELLEKYLRGDCTADEKQAVEAWYMAFENEEGFTEGLNEQQKKTLEERLLQKIQLKIAQQEQETSSLPKPRMVAGRPERSRLVLKSPHRFQIAAVCIGLLFLSALLYRIFIYQSTIVHATGFGQTATLILPDGSVVTLNGNSTLEYAAGWKADRPRKVSLRGEAFFSVVHTTHHQKFTVTTNDQLQVEVLGTEFNVNARNTGTRVVLSSGRVRLRLPPAGESSNQSGRAKEVLMQPGNLVEFSKAKNSYLKKEVNPQVYTSWKEHKLVFDNSTLEEIIHILQETYGLEVLVPDKSLLQERFTGSVPNENAQILLIGLSKSFDLKITQTKRKVIILR